MRTLNIYATANVNKETGRKTHIESAHNDYKMVNTYFKQMAKQSQRAIISIRSALNNPGSEK